jgi:hypothetical protein
MSDAIASPTPFSPEADANEFLAAAKAYCAKQDRATRDAFAAEITTLRMSRNPHLEMELIQDKITCHGEDYDLSSIDFASDPSSGSLKHIFIKQSNKPLAQWCEIDGDGSISIIPEHTDEGT